jgi:hypothetical protein
MKYWAIDYVNSVDEECELVYNDQLYATEQEAEQAREATGRPDLFDVTWYSYPDLVDVYDREVTIGADLRVK